MLVRKPLVLYIDAYDSFSNNIISLLETSLNVSVRTIKIDNPALASDAALHEELRHYAAVVCGPGPGHPEKEEDVGIMRRIWKLRDEELLPVLGVCLGFQSLCLEFGGKVERLRGPQHGMIRRVNHVGERGRGGGTIFEGVGDITATHYHSLCVDLGHKEMLKQGANSAIWRPANQSPELLPLAWVTCDLSEENKLGVKDELVLVAVEHTTKPFWALQYHPESICTNPESRKVITNWFKHAQLWNRRLGRGQVTTDGPIEGQPATQESLLSLFERQAERPLKSRSPNWTCYSESIQIPAHITAPDIVEAVLDLSEDQIILESSNANQKSVGAAKVKGRYTIIACEVDSSPRFEYISGNHQVVETFGPANGRQTRTLDLRPLGGIWPFLAQHLDSRKVNSGPHELPFWGGFIGYTTYELGLETIRVKSTGRKPGHSRPDLCFAWIEKSIVIDHQTNCLYVQQLGPLDMGAQREALHDIAGYISVLKRNLFPKESSAKSALTIYDMPCGTTTEEIIESLENTSVRMPSSIKLYERNNSVLAVCHYTHPPLYHIPKELLEIEISAQNVQMIKGSDILKGSTSVKFSHHAETGKAVDFTLLKESIPKRHPAFSMITPNPTAYESSALACQKHIRAGDTYELCLTSKMTITTPSTNAWSLYKTLRLKQPAPFASYIRLSNTTFLSASPERFLSYDDTAGISELRPMKGTVKKSPEVPTLKEALPLLDVPKEKAENLMIVDLVRHDLFGVCGSGNVEVPRLMVVEEYASVFQMISIVRGTYPISRFHVPSPPLNIKTLPFSNHHSQPIKLQTNKIEESSKSQPHTGLDILSSSLPPGSMTGAPKKRSVELLQDLEGNLERRLYSGVVGYLDVGGRGDWSVNIRCLFRFDDESDSDGEKDGDEGKKEKKEKWYAGAGGAVTILSGEIQEREEMETKLEGTKSIFNLL